MFVITPAVTGRCLSAGASAAGLICPCGADQPTAIMPWGGLVSSVLQRARARRLHATDEEMAAAVPGEAINGKVSTEESAAATPGPCGSCSEM